MFPCSLVPDLPTHAETAMHIDQIYQDGRHYDRLFGPPQPLPAFWFEAAATYGDPILELACGTGRIILPLAAQGHEVTGIDLSTSMLAEAQRKSQAAGLPIALRLADMRHFDLEQQYHLVILANNALCHLQTLADFEACMASIHRQLAAEGRLIVEVFVPNLELLLLTADQRTPFARYDDPDGAGEIVVTQTAWYDPATQIRHNTTYYRFPGQREEVAGTLDMRMYFPQELDALLHYNGFAIEQKFGGFDRRPFDATASTQLVILTKR
jgi:SAM-dependent methyltransferase